uniref:Serine aminopeptidase S33 domain-containing protein n=1 Tax=Aegilops tauschii subsp. strangulata TaxID=200361 RepID=A0A453H838_AEGTS
GSDGLHGYVQSLDLAVQDMKMYLKKISAENPGVPCFCFGHSTGGGIILKVLPSPVTCLFHMNCVCNQDVYLIVFLFWL